MAHTDEGDLDQVYGNLMSGSENHLRAFAGLIVVAQLLSLPEAWARTLAGRDSTT